MTPPKQEILGPHPDFPDSNVAFDSDLGFYRTFPYPSDESLKRYYTQEYRNIRQESPDENYLRFMRYRALEQTKFILNASSRHHFKSVIDIGCGCGELLNALQPHAAELHGFETDTVMAGHASAHCLCPSVKIHNEHYSPAKHLISSDLITMSHVLEHIPNPVEFLTNLRTNSLTLGGIMFLEVPNEPLYWLKMQMARKQRGLGHLNYFTPASLSTTLSAAGLKVLDIRCFGITLHEHIHIISRSRLARRLASVLARMTPNTGDVPNYTQRLPGEDGIYLQALAVSE